ncbi:DUF4232 domain-containing protein [Embleya sp. NBC_00888]|uniref:DUF4232 domain-containing protein n=1 Tax=Embleya sp. NBC_00888 TaxID=2975960 RepID=UPI003870066A|nr:DUF4232 domain-containing protein [Embleya sp. NBC_00888]
MFGQRRKAILVSAALATGAMLMTACQDTDSDKNTGAAPPPASAPAGQAGNATTPPAASTTGGNQSGGQGSGTTPAGKTSAGQGTTGTTGTTGGAGAGDNGSIGKCRTDDLQVTAQDATIGGDTNHTVAVTFKNIGHNCTMSGFAGVDLQTSAGPLSAKRTGAPADPFTLKSEKSVSFGITYPANDSGGSGVRVTGLQVTPPGETKSVTLRWPGAGSLPVTDGTGSPVNVGPIGSAGQGG